MREETDFQYDKAVPESRKLRHRKCTMEFVPLRKVLKQFFSLPSMIEECMQYNTNLLRDESGMIRNIVQAKFWREKLTAYPNVGTGYPRCSILVHLQ